MSLPKKSLRRFIFLTAVIASLLLFGASYWLFNKVFQDSIRDSALEQASSMAQITFQSMTQVMFQGWSRQQLIDFIESTQKSFTNASVEIDIYRGDLVSQRYGDLPQPKAVDALIKTALAGGDTAKLWEDETARFIHPLRAEARCLGCHDNARQGDILGVVDVRQDLSRLLQQARERFILGGLALAPLPFLIAFFIVRKITTRLEHGLGALRTQLSSINKASDLQALQLDEKDLGYREIGQVFEESRAITEKFRSIVVDKELLEFEFRLLEKFIITSEVISDWREHIKDLLMEINKVIRAYTLFSIFKGDDNQFILEIFWLHKPEDGLSEHIVARIRHIFRQHPQFSDISEIQINHTIADSSQTLPVSSEEQIELQTKSFLVDKPMIGGIVGIGVQSEEAQERSRELIIESILTTLLNVVGSVKAMHKYTQDLEYYATRDPLTHLYNQRMFWELLSSETSRAHRHQQQYALLLIDIDNFKSINDTHGHLAGDKFLQEAALSIQAALREEDVLTRYGGDEFALILPEVNQKEAQITAERIIDAVPRINITLDGGVTVRASVSIGLAVYPDHAEDMRDIFLLADNMMYRAKEAGKNRAMHPSSEDVARIFREIGEKSQFVLSAVENRLLVPYFQPIVSTLNGELEAVEVLSRIPSEDGVFEAGQFIELAERMGVIHKLDYIILDKALEEVKRTGYSGLVFVNLSPRALVLNQFLDEVVSIVKRHGVDPSRLVFEMTERETIRNIKLLSKFVVALKLEGFKLAIDDFGSGFSSYNYLKHFPIDFLKIEGEFVRNAVKSEKDAAFVRNIAQLADELQIHSIGEFVEDAETLEIIGRLGVTYGQGWHIGKPAPSLDNLA
jgi:diguanylate cyclase (GGDEF)-like protein